MDKEKNLLEEVQPNFQTETQVSEPELQLSENEKAFIEAQRLEGQKLEAFRNGYQRLVQETGYAWVVDGQSPVANPKLGVVKVG